jgi:hypothetical protein
MGTLGEARKRALPFPPQGESRASMIAAGAIAAERVSIECAGPKGRTAGTGA